MCSPLSGLELEDAEKLDAIVNYKYCVRYGRANQNTVKGGD